MLWSFGTGAASAGKGRLDRQSCDIDARILMTVVRDKKVQDDRYGVALAQKSPERPYAGSPEGMRPVTTLTSDAWKGWEGERPSTGLIQAWLNQADTPLADCWKDDPSGAPMRVLSDAEYAYQMSGPFARDKTIFKVSLPVLDATTTHALVYVETICPGLCGLKVLYMLDRKDDGWIITGSRVLAIS